jgi:hypothetical protein
VYNFIFSIEVYRILIIVPPIPWIVYTIFALIIIITGLIVFIVEIILTFTHE